MNSRVVATQPVVKKFKPRELLEVFIQSSKENLKLFGELAPVAFLLFPDRVDTLDIRDFFVSYEAKEGFPACMRECSRKAQALLWISEAWAAEATEDAAELLEAQRKGEALLVHARPNRKQIVRLELRWRGKKPLVAEYEFTHGAGDVFFGPVRIEEVVPHPDSRFADLLGDEGREGP